MAQTLDSASPATTLTIVKTHDVWNLETDDSAFLAIIFTNGHDYYYCNYANLRLPDDVALLAAQAILIPRTYYQAQSPHGLHRVPKSLPEDTYLKGDINPHNIVFDVTNLRAPVIIDFDSCYQEGEKITGNAWTFGQSSRAQMFKFIISQCYDCPRKAIFLICVVSLGIQARFPERLFLNEKSNALFSYVSTDEARVIPRKVQAFPEEQKNALQNSFSPLQGDTKKLESKVDKSQTANAMAVQAEGRPSSVVDRITEMATISLKKFDCRRTYQSQRLSRPLSSA
ncbi:hypothetical protein BT96DRAFT_978029 [Gymnopus androsaceus JB14]|uniref:Uncharacterized protein n=1 Tax=Gymnopus androsaceus JB14 TaxID=1447944 RepID=A0A6A4HDF2_9AGAR|nr:hypothetical protein BT96DRAFT_978029 [Gymnopus androsaceus JB14]